jgi:hypothetical protein
MPATQTLKLGKSEMNFRNGKRIVPAAALLLVIGSGCGPEIQNAPVDADKARATLRTALESWKKGEPATALQNLSPPIYIIDQEWQAGAKLISYEMIGDGEEKDANLFCKVKLTTRTSAGKEVQQEVTFVVSTAPNLTVTRKIF